ncbi:hypothetical protein GCM10022393_00480 [Aquimarina addita]|uniref:Knr4/Smi1-like domain-containing protein n=1 Tax=Aquimarina addita TaxID=870485 RepID=A0ABP7X6Y1_9FLAO
MYLTESKKYLKDYPEITKDFRGCNDEQIVALESLLNVKIPEAYKEFLRWFGLKGGQIMRGSDFYYRYLIGEAYEDYIEEGIYNEDVSLKKFAIELLDEYGFDGEKLLEDAIVIMSHQGTAYQYIKLDGSENPKVYMFAEQGDWLKNGPMVWAESFSDYMVNMLKQNIDSLKHIGYLK